jgi:hypothetical protein
VNFANLRDVSSILNFGSVPGETFDKGTLSLSVPQIVVYDPSQSPPVRAITGTFSNTSPKFNIDPPLVVSKDALATVQIDFDLRNSIVLDAQGQVTGTVNPILKAQSLTANATTGFGPMEDLLGFVTSVTPFSTNSNFIGSFALQLFSGSLGQAPLLNVSLTNSTQVFGVDALNHLLTGSVVETNGFVDSKGNFVATYVEVEDQAVVASNQFALVGTILSLSRDASGNLTEFDFYVGEEAPQVSTIVRLDQVVQVNVSGSTRYQFSSRLANFAGFPFDSSALAVGQQVIVHGTATPPPSGSTNPTTIAASSVYLKLQTHVGNFASVIAVGSDNKTGAFWFAPCATLFRGTRILVLTNNQTEFINLSGLEALTSQPSLLVKGLLFFEAQGGTANGVTIPPGTLVLVANGVHQLT